MMRPWRIIGGPTHRDSPAQRPDVVTLLQTLYVIAIIAEAMSGAIMAIRRGMDLFGICLIGIVTALGGGTVRDMVLGHYPVGWIAHPEYLLFTGGAALLAALVARHLHRLRQAFLIVDALGLVAFAVIGCDVALSMGLNPAIVVLAGLITGVFGGLLRDLLCNEMPLVLCRELYATVALATGIIYVGLQMLGVSAGMATLPALLLGFLLRMMALRYRWQLPRIDANDVRGLE